MDRAEPLALSPVYRLLPRNHALTHAINDTPAIVTAQRAASISGSAGAAATR
jgi:hypothetical protein